MQMEDLVGIYYPSDTYEYLFEVILDKNRLKYRSGSTKGIKHQGYFTSTKKEILEMIKDYYPVKCSSNSIYY